jgi:hypothetical protein
VDGFFPKVDSAARPLAQRRLGLTTLGLPYASDPGITRHLAAFLSKHKGALEAQATAALQLAGKTFLHPTAILFNGGVMKARELEERVVEVLGGWIQAEGGQAPKVLPGSELDLAVAQGAACFGRVKNGRGIRIRGGTARAYYVGIETAMPAVPGMPPPLKALCLAPMGMEEGTSAELPSAELGLVVGDPRSSASSLLGPPRRQGRHGGRAVGGRARGMPPLEATLPAASASAPARVVPIHLRAHVTEIAPWRSSAWRRAARPGSWSST